VLCMIMRSAIQLIVKLYIFHHKSCHKVGQYSCGLTCASLAGETAVTSCHCCAAFYDGGMAMIDDEKRKRFQKDHQR